MLEKPEKVVTDEPTTNYGTVLNYARVKDREVVLSYADGEEDVSLYEYIAKLATEKGCSCTADDVRNGSNCSCECGCDCEVLILNIVAIQAAELRERLKYYEKEDKTTELP